VDTATLIRSARHRAGMTQADLAARAHTSAPTISAYEHGTKQPRADVLLRLLRAAGVEPTLVPAATSNPHIVTLSGASRRPLRVESDDGPPTRRDADSRSADLRAEVRTGCGR
jgi:transcriptional regulator with XRE-family HTH domain